MNKTVITAKTAVSLQTDFVKALVQWIVETSDPFYAIEHMSF